VPVLYLAHMLKESEVRDPPDPYGSKAADLSRPPRLPGNGAGAWESVSPGRGDAAMSRDSELNDAYGLIVDLRAENSRLKALIAKLVLRAGNEDPATLGSEIPGPAGAVSNTDAENAEQVVARILAGKAPYPFRTPAGSSAASCYAAFVSPD